MSDKYWISNSPRLSEEHLIILNEYLLSLKLANKAKATVTKYRSILERFLNECPIPLESLTSEDVLEWLKAFSVGKKDRTIDLFLSCLSSFFQFCLEEDYMENRVLKKRWRPKINPSLPKYLTEEEYSRVMIAAEELSLRNRALVLLLFSSGCRIGELCNLLIQDVDLSERTAIVQGKGNKIRTIHFSIECAIVLQEYLTSRDYQDDDPLFLNKFGQALGQSGVKKVVGHFGKMAGLTQSLHPHVCRHTFATNMLARGADIQFIAEELGHADLNTTRVYARIPTEEMMTSYQNKMG